MCSMKKIILLLVILTGMVNLHGQDLRKLQDKKTAILMVHFGTTFDDTRALTIDAINDKLNKLFLRLR